MNASRFILMLWLLSAPSLAAAVEPLEQIIFNEFHNAAYAPVKKPLTPDSYQPVIELANKANLAMQSGGFDEELRTRKELIATLSGFFGDDYWHLRLERALLAGAEKRAKLNEADANRWIAARKRLAETATDAADENRREQLAAYREVIGETIALLGKDDACLIDLHLLSGQAHLRLREHQLAFNEFAEVVRISDKVLGELHPYAALAYRAMGDVEVNSNHYKAARSYYVHARQIHTTNGIHPTKHYAELLLCLAIVENQLGEYRSAEESAGEALSCYRMLDLHGEDFQSCQAQLGHSLLKQGRVFAAVEFYKKLTWIESSRGPVATVARRDYIAALRATGREEAADAVAKGMEKKAE